MDFHRTRLIVSLIAAVLQYLPTAHSANDNTTALSVRTNVVTDTSTGDFRLSRRTVTGTGTNQHPDYPGCTGFLGWESVTQLKNGELLCSFSAGYWHVSFPTPFDIESDTLARYQKRGFHADVIAPTGGRTLLSRSSDNGKTWTQPKTMIDTAGDDRHPVIVELTDGSLLCQFFVIDNWYGYEEAPAGRNKNLSLIHI